MLVIKMKRFPLEVEFVSLPGSALLWILFLLCFFLMTDVTVLGRQV